MQPTALLSLLTTLFLTSSAMPLTSRNDKTDPMIVAFWENGCDVSGTGNTQTFIYTTTPDDGFSKPGECIPTPLYNWQSVKVTQDSGKSYKVELFSGEGCNNPITTVTEDGCYTQPEGQIVLSARASLA